MAKKPPSLEPRSYSPHPDAFSILGRRFEEMRERFTDPETGEFSLTDEFYVYQYVALDLIEEFDPDMPSKALRNPAKTDQFLIDFFWQLHGEDKSKRQAMGSAGNARYKRLCKSDQSMVDYIEKLVLKAIKHNK